MFVRNCMHLWICAHGHNFCARRFTRLQLVPAPSRGHYTEPRLCVRLRTFFCLSTVLTTAERISPCRPWRPFYDFVLQHCLALCHVFDASKSFFGTPGCCLLFRPRVGRIRTVLSDCRLPYNVRHPLFGRSLSTSGSNTLSAVGQENSCLSGVQSRSEFVRNDDLVSFQGAVDRNRKTVSLRGIHKVLLERPVMASPLYELSSTSRHELSSSSSWCRKRLSAAKLSLECPSHTQAIRQFHSRPVVMVK